MPSTYPILTERLALRPLAFTDLDDLYEYHSRPDVMRFLYWNPRTRAETEQYLAERVDLITITQPDERIALAVVVQKINKVIGEVMLMLKSVEHRQGEIGFVLNPAYQGLGYATEAARAMLTLGFTEYNFHRICSQCDARNTASYSVMERLGMRREAHFVQNELFKGEWSDLLIYAMLQEEWNRPGAVSPQTRP